MQFSKLAVFLGCALSLAAADYTTYIGDAFSYTVTAMAVDPSGNTYLTGGRALPVNGTSFILTDIFVSKLDPSGNINLLATLSGKASGRANAIALDPSGDIYLAGSTTSPDFPLHDPLQSVLASPAGFPPIGTGFLVKLGPDGTILYSTYFGGTKGPSSMNSVTADSQGYAYVTGETFAQDYPHTSGLPQGSVGAGLGAVCAAFFAKISPAGDKILYAGGLAAATRGCQGGSSCFLSTLDTAGRGTAVDSAGNAYLAGNTYGTDLPTTPGALRTSGIGAFVAKVNSSGTGMGYVTLLGAANYNAGGVFPGSNPGTLAYAIAADAAGNAYVAGSTSDPAFPATPSAFQTMLSVTSPPNSFSAPPSDGFVAKLNPTGSAMVWATFLGGTNTDKANTITPDSAGDVWVSGTNAVVPLALLTMPSSFLRVTLNSGALPDFRLVVDAAIPQVARNGDGSAAAINQDGTVNSGTHPAPVGSFVSIWATGTGYAPGMDGQMATTAQSFCSCIIHDIAVNQDIFPSYAGTAPGMVNGVVQINFQAPGTGTFFSLDVNGKTSDAFSIEVSQ